MIHIRPTVTDRAVEGAAIVPGTPLPGEESTAPVPGTLPLGDGEGGGLPRVENGQPGQRGRTISVDIAPHPDTTVGPVLQGDGVLRVPHIGGRGAVKTGGVGMPPAEADGRGSRRPDDNQ